MSPLSKEEILDQLKNIGIDSSSEVDFYLTEYKEYVDLPEAHEFSPKAYTDEALINYPQHDRAVNGFSRVFRLLAPRIAYAMRSVRDSASRKNKH